MSPGVLPFPVHIVSAGNLRDNVLESCKPQGGRFTAVPFFSREVLPAGSVQPVYDEEASGGPDGEASGALVQVGTRTLVRDEYRDGIGKRQCTHEFKIAPITKKLRALLGYAPRRRIPVGSVEVWLGISLDEAIRMKPSRTAWQVNRWPLVEARLSRHAGAAIYAFQPPAAGRSRPEHGGRSRPDQPVHQRVRWHVRCLACCPAGGGEPGGDGLMRE